MQIINRCTRTAHTAMRKVYTSLSKINFEIHAQKEKFLLNLKFFIFLKILNLFVQILILIFFKSSIWCPSVTGLLVKLSSSEISEIDLHRGVGRDLRTFGRKRESFPPLPLFNWSQAGVYANERRPEVARVNSGGWWGRRSRLRSHAHAKPDGQVQARAPNTPQSGGPHSERLKSLTVL